MNLVKINCAFCGKEFFRTNGQYNEAKKFGWKQYCSPGCIAASRIKSGVLFCENCGKPFERIWSAVSPHNYCSQSCAAIANNKKCLKGHAKMAPKLKVCIKCGKPYRKSTGNKKYCSIKCRGGAEGYTREELLDIIKNNVHRLKRVPARRELDKISSTCRRVFGSWNNAILAAGFQPNRSHSQRIYKRVHAVATDGHNCDSISEALIDNWLTKNRIPHERNVYYPETNYRADWAISSKNNKVFVEYFGLANDSPRYDRTIQKKRELCQKYNFKLIEIYPQDLYPKKNRSRKLRNKFIN